MEQIIIQLKEALKGIQKEMMGMSGLTGNKDWEEGYANGWKDAVDTIVELLANKK
ncbi:MAG: hypothetical protein WC917_00330 [Bacilli bacterium]|jgi:hypothetical protein